MTTHHHDDPKTGISRRQFIGALGVGAAAGATPSLLRSTRAGAAPLPQGLHSATSRPQLNGDGVLVVVTLYGGNDGLDTVVPAADPAYQSARRDLAWRPDQVLPLSDGFGLNPSMPGLAQHFGTGQLAIVQGVGYPNPNRSHFRSMDIWQSGVPDSVVNTGWLGRWNDTLTADPTRIAHVGASVPRAFVGLKASAAAIPNGQISLPPALVRGFTAQTQLGSELGPWAARVASSGADLLKVKDTLGPMLRNTAASSGSSLEGGAAANGDAGNELDDQLQVVLALLRAGASTRVFSVSLGGFDTHVSERDQHNRLLKTVDTALTKFQQALASVRGGDRVVTVVYSEFGRRVNANLSSGTDHGTAAPVFVLGASVSGGFKGNAPSLTDLDQGDLRYTTDFRSIYAAVLQRVLGADPQQILSGWSAALPELF